MTKIFSKYLFRSLSVILLVSFLFSNISLCEILIENCEAESMSCCCKESAEKTKSINYKKNCCCEIKEAATEPLETSSATAENNINVKMFSKDIQTGKSFTNIDGLSSGFHLQPVSFQSPPDSDINILYSVFRI